MSLFDKRIDISALEENVRRVAAALAAFIYNKPLSVASELVDGSLDVSRDHLQVRHFDSNRTPLDSALRCHPPHASFILHFQAVLDFVTSQPRATQVLLEKSNTVVPTLKHMMTRYLSKSSVKTSIFEPDRREPEFVLYDQTTATLQISEVKPVLFDLVLLLIIASYLALVYFSVNEFGIVVRALTPKRMKKVD